MRRCTSWCRTTGSRSRRRARSWKRVESQLNFLRLCSTIPKWTSLTGKRLLLANSAYLKKNSETLVNPSFLAPYGFTSVTEYIRIDCCTPVYYYVRPIDHTYCATAFYRLSTFGHHTFSLVLLRGTLYLIVSVIQHRVLAVLGNYLKRGVICELLNILSAVDICRDSALYKLTIDIR